MPAAEIVRVPGLARGVGGGWAEIAAIAEGALRQPIDVSTGRPRLRLESAPTRAVAHGVLPGRAIRVGVVAGGKDRPADPVDQPRGLLVARGTTFADLSGADDDRIGRGRWLIAGRARGGPGPRRREAHASDSCRGVGRGRRGASGCTSTAADDGE